MTSCDVNKKCTKCENDGKKYDCKLPSAYAADTDGGLVFLCGRCGEVMDDYVMDLGCGIERRCHVCEHKVIDASIDYADIFGKDKIKYIAENGEEPNFEENFKD